jgi:hypothetical protein
MNIFKSICRAHDHMPIVNVCMRGTLLDNVGDAVVPLCAKCLNDHIHQHRKRGIECELIDTKMFVNKYEGMRIKTAC